MGNASSLPKQMETASVSSSPEQTQPTSRPPSLGQVQLVFVPSSLDSKPISVSDSLFTSSGLPKEVLSKIANLIGIKMTRNLMSTCKSLRNHLNTSLLQTLASEKNPDRATSRFIADAIGNNDDIYLWLNAEFSLKGHYIPRSMSIHLLTNVAAQKISSDEVRAMIIQLFEPYNPFGSHRDACEFLKFFFPKVSFKNLECLMLYGIQLSTEFLPVIGKLRLKAFHMAKFSYHASLLSSDCFGRWNSLETLCMVHPGNDMVVQLPQKSKKLVIYCPESNIITRTTTHLNKLAIELGERHVCEEM
jgi:hypothetical protein